MNDNIILQPLKNFIQTDELSPENQDSILAKKMLDMPIKETPFYKNYLRYFDLTGIDENLILPENIDRDMIDLFLKLIFASFTSEFEFEVENNGDIKIFIYPATLEKTNEYIYIDTLFEFQIYKSLSILLSEQVEWEILKEDENAESDILEREKTRKLNVFYRKKEEAFRKRLVNLIKYFKE